MKEEEIVRERGRVEKRDREREKRRKECGIGWNQMKKNIKEWKVGDERVE